MTVAGCLWTKCRNRKTVLIIHNSVAVCHKTQFWVISNLWFCSIGYRVCPRGPFETSGPGWALGAGGCPASSGAALPWKHGRSQEMWKWRIHIKVSLKLSEPLPVLLLFLECFWKSPCNRSHVCICSFVLYLKHEWRQASLSTWWD